MAVVQAESRPAWPLRRLKSVHWSLLRWGAAAGALGGLAGWAIGEPLNTASATASLVHVYADAFVYFLAVSAGIGAVLGALPGALNRSWRQVLRGGLLGLVVGGVLGGLGGLPAQYAFHALGEGLSARAVGWGIVGAAIGLCPGAATRDRRRALRGLFGGFLGGFVGGLLFNLAAALVPRGAADTGTASRLIADLVVGLCVGLAVALVEAALKRAWLTVISGRREGAQFILSKETTAIGRDDRDDVILWGDPQLASGHARISRRKGRYVLERGPGDAAMLLNGQPIAGMAALRDGDEIVLGLTRLRFQTRGASQQAPQPVTVARPQAAASALPTAAPYTGSSAAGTASVQTVPTPGRYDDGPGREAMGHAPAASVAPPFTAAPTVPPLPASAVPTAPKTAVPASPMPAVPSAPMPAVPSAPMPAVPSAPMPVVPPVPVAAASASSAPASRVARLIEVAGSRGASGGQAYELPRRAVLTVGRDAGNDVVIGDETVSARHAELRYEGDRWVVYDRASANGTFVSYGGAPTAERRVDRNALKAGSTVRFGSVTLRLDVS